MKKQSTSIMKAKSIKRISLEEIRTELITRKVNVLPPSLILADIEEANLALKKSLDELKSTQPQLIQAEKMASLGELTAGIANEIQNPLNFVTTFRN